jgi:pimeloyl-ACP methyl ester carboxylesterase
MAPPLVALHGWGQSMASLQPLAQKLAWDREVILIDLPGFGRSAWSGEDWNTRDYALCLLNALDRWGLPRVDLLGHSFGGRIGLRLASQWPGRVGRLILVDSAGIPRRRPWGQRLRHHAVRAIGVACHLLPGSAATGWYRRRFGSQDYLAAGHLRPTLIKTVTEDQTPGLSHITAPTLLLWGELDDTTPPEMAHRFHRLIRGSRLELLPELGHTPFVGPGVHACAQLVREFLQETARLSTSEGSP